MFNISPIQLALHPDHGTTNQETACPGLSTAYPGHFWSNPLVFRGRRLKRRVKKMTEISESKMELEAAEYKSVILSVMQEEWADDQSFP